MRSWFVYIVMILGVIALSASCGLLESDYIDYNEEDGGGPAEDPNDPCVQAALASFEKELQPGVESSCANSGCHLNLASRPLTPDDKEENRKQLKDYAGGNADTLFNKISANGVPHSGGDQSAAITKANIDVWLAKEAECN